MPLPVYGVLAGMDETVMRDMLNKAVSAYGNLMSGGQVETITYAQGDGSRSVTYTKANMVQLDQWIKQLQRALGIPVAPRRPMVPYYQ